MSFPQVLPVFFYEHFYTGFQNSLSLTSCQVIDELSSTPTSNLFSRITVLIMGGIDYFN